MMIRFLLIMSYFLFVVSCKNSTESSKTNRLAKEKQQIELADTCKTFIEKFPSTFNEFNRLYGYNEEEGELYSQYEEDLNYFFNCSDVPVPDKMKKCISVCIGGEWDADAVGMLQHETLKLIKGNYKIALSMLDKLSNENAGSVWYFLFDGPHPNNEDNLETITYLSDKFGKDSKQVQILREQFNRLKSKESH